MAGQVRAVNARRARLINRERITFRIRRTREKLRVINDKRAIFFNVERRQLRLLRRIVNIGNGDIDGIGIQRRERRV